MKKSRRAVAFVIFIIVAIIVIVALGVLTYIGRQDQKQKFDEMFNAKILLRVEYGEVIREHKLKEVNALFERVEQDQKLYLYITDDNILFTYYTDTYYSFDPMKGYVLEEKINLTNKQKNKLLDDIREITIDNLTAKIETEYMPIRIDDTNLWVSRHDFQMVLQENNIMITVNEKDPGSDTQKKK